MSHSVVILNWHSPPLIHRRRLKRKTPPLQHRRPRHEKQQHFGKVDRCHNNTAPKEKKGHYQGLGQERGAPRGVTVAAPPLAVPVLVRLALSKIRCCSSFPNPR